MVQNTKYDGFAAETVDAVGGPGNIKQVTHCTTRLRFQLNDLGKVDKARIQALPEAITVMEASGGLHVVVGMGVPDAHKAVAAIPGVNAGGEVAATSGAGDDGAGDATEARATPADPDAKKPKVIDRILGTISAIFTPYIPVLASIGIIKGLLGLFVGFGWMSVESDTYIILNAAPTALIYFFPILLAFTAAKQFGANPYVGAVIGAALLEPGLAAINVSGETADFLGIPFPAQSFANTVIPIILGMWAFGYLEKGLKRALPKITHLILVPVISVLVMVPLMLLVFGPVGFTIANGIASGYNWLVQFPIVLSLIFGGFFIYVIMIGAHWIVLPIQLGILADQGMEYSLAAGGMGNYALLGVTLAVMFFNRDKATKQVAGSASFVNALSGVTEPGMFGVIVRNKRYFITLTLGGLAGGLVCGIFGTYITAFAFTGLFGLPAFASSPTAVPYFIAVGVTILVSFIGTFFVEKGMARSLRRNAGADETVGEKQTASVPA
ncbi:PTS transporter subunit EIIC [Herbiconiux sp. L3-i23]|uniref:PTS transporter subunit EIIC n=1 Tax=Herbiconiux sp. L3-i23 TaxID=2905871 RepID=UPI0020739317|nr:PTS transporter subunit EIIC [Herbiconiux sp. L3-i23]